MAATRPIAIERRAAFLQTVASTLQRCGEIGPVSGIVPSSRRSASELAARATACALPTAGADAEPRLKCLFLSKFVRAHQSRRRIVQRDESTIRQRPQSEALYSNGSPSSGGT
jgi:hypothetical protein